MSSYVYLLRCGPFYKIGITHDVSRRLCQLRTQPPFDIELYHVFKATDPAWAERFLHTVFRDQRKNGEWFALSKAQVDWIAGIVGEHNMTFSISDIYVHAAYDMGAEAVLRRLPGIANPFVPGTICWRSWKSAHHDLAVCGPKAYLWRDPYPEQFDRAREDEGAEVGDG